MGYSPVFIARQPIYFQDKTLAAYELLFRHSGQASVAQILNDDQATSQVIVDGVSLATEGLPKDLKIFINFSKYLLIERAALSLSPEVCVVEVVERVEPESDVVEALQELKDLGYIVALDDYVGQQNYEPFLKLADIVKVDFLEGDTSQVIKWVQQIQPYNVEILAEKVETAEGFKLGKTLGCKYFQGYYFSRPQIITGRTLSLELTGKMRLLERLNDKDCELDELSKIIGQNLSLSYRLLRFINSSAFSLHTKISSISQAVALLGLNPLKRWVMVVIISDINESPSGKELTFTSLQRACFLDSLGKQLASSCHSPDTLFLLGLFSKLDALLGVSMEEALRPIPLEDEVRRALLGQNSNNSRDWLDLLEALELARYDLADHLMDKYGLNHETTAWLYADALGWAHRTLAHVSRADDSLE